MTRKLTISCDPEAMRHPRGDSGSVYLFQITVETPEWVWEETFATVSEVQAFMRGMQAASSVFGKYISVPGVSVHAEKTAADTELEKGE